MSEITNYLERAEKARQKGRHDVALKAYLDVLQLDPAHEAASQAAADLCLTLGRGAQGLELLSGIFQRQLAGANPAAVASYHRLSKLGFVPPEQTLQVARLLEKTNRAEALEIYERAKRGFLADGHRAEAIAVLENVAALRPAVETFEELARLSLEAHNPWKAVSALLRAGELAAAEKPASALEYYRRACALDPSNVKAALTYARELLAQGTVNDAELAARSLQPFSSGTAATVEVRALYGRALLEASRVHDAEPFLAAVFAQDPAQVHTVLRAIGEWLDTGQVSDAVQLARRTEECERQAGRLREYARLMYELAKRHTTPFEFLQYLAELFNACNREHEYSEILLQLFDYYYAERNFPKAGECLDRAAEIDPYENGHKRRLELLSGKLTPARLRMIAGRLTGAVTAPDVNIAAAADTPDESETNVLDDLILQAEIFLRYGMRARVTERLQRINKLFPGEELKNEKLRDLFADAGFVPEPAPRTASDERDGVAKGQPRQSGAVDDWGRLSEIIRNISRQGSEKSVLFTTVNEAGRYWRASRCVAVLCSPAKPPSIALEYCAPGVKRSDVHGIVKLIALLQPLVVAHGPLVIPSPSAPPAVAPLKQFAASLGIGSLLAMPLIEAEEHAGLIVLARAPLPTASGGSPVAAEWSPADAVMLKTVADQAVLAVSNVRLRRLVKSLEVTEEHSGLFKRSSYCDLLVAEARRVVRQNSPLSVVLINVGNPAELVRQMGEAATESLMQQLGQLVCSHIRQSDMAVRYDSTTLAVILGDTNAGNAQLATEKFRRLLANTRVPAFAAGIAEAVSEPGFDPIDIVTELINRAEAALERALGAGGNNQVCSLAPTDLCTVDVAS